MSDSCKMHSLWVHGCADCARVRKAWFEAKAQAHRDVLEGAAWVKEATDGLFELIDASGGRIKITQVSLREHLNISGQQLYALREHLRKIGALLEEKNNGTIVYSRPGGSPAQIHIQLRDPGLPAKFEALQAGYRQLRSMYDAAVAHHDAQIQELTIQLRGAEAAIKLLMGPMLARVRAEGIKAGPV